MTKTLNMIVISTADEWKVQFELNGKICTAKCSLRKDVRGQYDKVFTFQGIMYKFYVSSNNNEVFGLQVLKINPSFYRKATNVNLTEI